MAKLERPEHSQKVLNQSEIIIKLVMSVLTSSPLFLLIGG